MTDIEDFTIETTNINPFTINPIINTSIETFDIHTSNVFIERPKFYVAGEMIPTMKDKYDLLIQEQAIKAKNDKLSIKLQKQIDKTQSKFTELLKSFKTTTDEDDYATLKLIGDNIDRKLEDMTAKRIENQRIRINNTALDKYNKVKANSRKKIVDLGFTGKDLIALCSRCKLHKPYHIDFRPLLPENHPLYEKGYRFSQTCHICINKGKGFSDDNLGNSSDISNDKKITKNINAVNKKCYCGMIIQHPNGRKEGCCNYEKHLTSKHHKLYDMIEDSKTDVAFIDFNLFSVGQLRYLIQNNKKPDGSNIITNYARKTKAQLLEAIKLYITPDMITHDILKISMCKSTAKPKKEGIVHPELIKDNSDDDENYDSNEDYSIDSDDNNAPHMNFKYDELDTEFIDRPLDIDFRNDADYKDDYNDEYEYNND